jgi:hypothetical protein
MCTSTSMRRLWKTAAVLVLSILTIASGSAPAAPPVKTVTIADWIGVAWTEELVHEDLSFPPGELTGLPLARVAIGNTSLASQVSDVVRHADSSIQSMAVWFLATVPANGAVTYTITPGKAGPDTAGAAAKTTPESIELTTSKIPKARTTSSSATPSAANPPS